MEKEKFIIQGCAKLYGEIEVMGAKNAATPILAAAILTKKDCIIDNLPAIEDVVSMIDLLRTMGVSVEFIDKHKIKVNAANLDPSKMDYHIIRKLRSSILLLGVLFSRFTEFKIPSPGGCIIGARSIDAHLEAFSDLGAVIMEEDNCYYIRRGDLVGGKIVLNEFSVTATENLLLASVLSKGKTIIKLAAGEPHVLDLILFLKKMGAKIKWLENHILEVEGVDELKGTEHSIIYDPIEAGTFLILGIATKSKITIKNVNPDHIDLVLKKLKDFGANLEIGENQIKVLPYQKLKANNVKVEIYPGIPTDLQAPFAVLATQAEGTSLIHEHMYESRLRYIDELVKMGANAVICDPHRALITGPTPLFGKEIKSYDLRAGATLIIAALVAKGESIISDVYQVDRGYERIEERLQKIGANVVRR